MRVCKRFQRTELYKNIITIKNHFRKLRIIYNIQMLIHRTTQ